MLRPTQSPVPVFVALLAGLVVFASGCERGEVGDTPVARCYPEGQCDEAMFKRGVTAEGGDVTAGASLYKARCASCHGEDGKGKPPDTLRIDFTSVVWQARFRDGEIGQAIVAGKPPKMPPQSFSATQLRDLVAFMRSLKPKPKAAEPKTGY